MNNFTKYFSSGIIYLKGYGEFIAKYLKNLAFSSPNIYEINFQKGIDIPDHLWYTVV